MRGHRGAGPGDFFEPTVLGNVTSDARVLSEEIFGPVAPIASFESEDDAVAAANDQTAKSLAQILRHAGAVRAIELDINSTWVSFNTYSHRNGRGATKLLPGMSRDVTRYLTPDDRDFFAVYRRG